MIRSLTLNYHKLSIKQINIMKSFKSLFALIAIASLSFACASVTDADLADYNNDPAIEAPAPTDAVFGGTDSDPIITKPKM